MAASPTNTPPFAKGSSKSVAKPAELAACPGLLSVVDRLIKALLKAGFVDKRCIDADREVPPPLENALLVEAEVGTPSTVGNTYCGKSCPANPSFVYPVPLSITIAHRVIFTA